MDPRQLKRKADDEHQNGQEDPGEGPSSGSPPAPGPSPPKMPRREDKDIEKEAVDFLEKLLANETEVVLSLGDPLLNLSSVPDDVAMQSFEEILIDHPGDVIQQVQNVVWQIKLRLARNHTSHKNEGLFQINQIRLEMGKEFREVQNEMKGAMNVLSKLPEPFKDGRGILENTYRMLCDYQMPHGSDLSQKHTEAVKLTAKMAVRLAKKLEEIIFDREEQKQRCIYESLHYMTYTYSVQAVNSICLPKTINSHESAIMFLRGLPQYNSMEDVVRQGKHIMDMLDREPTEIANFSGMFKNMLESIKLSFRKETTLTTERFMMQMFAPVTQATAWVNTLSAFICSEPADMLLRNPPMTVEEIVKKMEFKINAVVRDMFLKMVVDRTDKVKTQSIEDFRQIIKDAEDEELLTNIIGGDPFSAVSMRSESDDESEEEEEQAETEEEVETESEEEEQAEEEQADTQTQEETQAEGQAEQAQAQAEEGQAEAGQAEEQAEEEVEEESEEEESLTESEIEMVLLKAGKPQVKQEPPSTSTHPMVTRSKKSHQ
ncbi:Ba156 [Baboon cytomegalovirus]|nr:Ba156 [Baboon cytomegalovirus]